MEYFIFMQAQWSRVAMVGGLALLAAADVVLIVLAAEETQDEAWIWGILTGPALLAGLLIGRWWAVALGVPLLLMWLPLYSQSEGQELTFIAFVVLIAGLAATVQTVALVLGVGVRWACEHPKEVKETLRR